MQSRPIGDDLNVRTESSSYAAETLLTRNFLLCVQVLEVTVSEPLSRSGPESGRVGHDSVTHWSLPMNDPDLASPMYCN